MRKPNLTALLGWIGFALFVAGWAMVYPPLAFIVGGLVLFVVGSLGSRSTTP